MQTFSRLVGPEIFRYDGFLSFRGDTRRGFTGFLRKYLRERGFHNFVDDWELQPGDQMTVKLLTAIEESKMFIIVLSKEYASSSFCLMELVHILRQFAKGNGRRILTVFYHVSPSEVLQGLAAHTKNVTPERLQKWTKALEKITAADSSIWQLKVTNDKPEPDYIEEIIREVSRHVACPIGLPRRVHKVMHHLSSKSNGGPCVVGICGDPGMGKSTLARGVYLYNADNGFDFHCFIRKMEEPISEPGFEARVVCGVYLYVASNGLGFYYTFIEKVGGHSSEDGLVHLKRMLLSEIAGTMFHNDHEGVEIMKNMLNRKKVFLVFEDVDDAEHLQVIVKLTKWFDSDSKVIITSRVKDLENYGIEKIYHIEGFDYVEALKLLSMKTFNSSKTDISVRYMTIFNQAISCASGNLCSLEKIGSSFEGKSVKDCRAALQECGEQEFTQSELQSSYSYQSSSSSLDLL